MKLLIIEFALRNQPPSGLSWVTPTILLSARFRLSPVWSSLILFASSVSITSGYLFAIVIYVLFNIFIVTHYSAAILVLKSAKSVLAATSAFNVVNVIVSACNALAANAP